MKVRWTFSSGPSRIRGFCFSCVLSFTLLAIFGCSGGSGGSGGSGNSGGGNTTPTAELTSFSPSMATVGSLPEKITLTGSHFTTASVVWTNGPNSWPVSLTTTFVSDTELKFTIPSQYVLSPGNLYITVIDSAPPYYQYNSLYLPIVNPVPVLNYILPTSVTAGTPNFILTLSGSGFIDSTTLLVNGAEAGQYGSSSNTEASFGIPSSSISTIGPVTIALYNPPPGGGTSAAQTLNVISADNRLRTLNLSAADLGWDSAHKLLIASTLEGSASNPNSIVAIDPLQGSVTATQSLPGQPAGISVTDDGSYVYVTLPSTGQIERFILPSLTPDITFALGNDSSGLPLATASVVAAPGDGQFVARTRGGHVQQRAFPQHRFGGGIR